MQKNKKNSTVDGRHGKSAEKNGRKKTTFFHFTLLVTQKLTVLEHKNVLSTNRNLVPIYKKSIFKIAKVTQ